MWRSGTQCVWICLQRSDGCERCIHMSITLWHIDYWTLPTFSISRKLALSCCVQFTCPSFLPRWLVAPSFVASGFRHWPREPEASDRGFIDQLLWGLRLSHSFAIKMERPAYAIEIEIAAYAVLAELLLNEDISYANPIVKWLMTQRVGGGVFGSTQVWTDSLKCYHLISPLTMQIEILYTEP